MHRICWAYIQYVIFWVYCCLWYAHECLFSKRNDIIPQQTPAQKIEAIKKHYNISSTKKKDVHYEE